MSNLKPLGNSGVNVSLEKIQQYIPSWFWENIYPSKEAAEAAGKTVYAVANEETNTYYVTNPLKGGYSLIAGESIQYTGSSADKEEVKFVDFLETEYKLPRWIVDVLLPQISKNGKQKIVCWPNSSFSRCQDAITAKGVSSAEEFVFVNLQNFPSQLFVYNTNISHVGTGRSYNINSGTIYAEFAYDSLTQDGATPRISRLESVLKNLKYENLQAVVSKKEEEPLDKQVTIVSNSGQELKIGLKQLQTHVPMWAFSNMFVRKYSETEPTFKMLEKSVLTELVFSTTKAELQTIYRKHRPAGSSEVFRNNLIKKFASSTKPAHIGIRGGELSDKEVEDYKQATVTVEDALGEKGDIPLWIWENVFSKQDKESFVFARSGQEVYLKIQKTLKGKPVTTISLNKNGGTEISISRSDDGQNVSYTVNGIAKLKDPTAVRYMIFNKGEFVPKVCIFGKDNIPADKFRTEKEFTDPDMIYEKALKLFNESQLKKNNIEKILNKLHEKISPSFNYIFSSKEEYKKAKSDLEKICAPCAVYYDEEKDQMCVSINAGYSGTDDSISSFDINPDTIDSVVSQIEKKVSIRFSEFVKLAGFYRFKETYEFIGKLLEKKFPQLSLYTTNGYNNCIRWQDQSKLEIIDGKGNVTAALSFKDSGLTKLEDELYKTFGKYFASDEAPAQVLSDIKHSLKLNMINSASELKDKNFKPFQVFSIKNSSLVYLTNRAGSLIGQFYLHKESDLESLTKSIATLNIIKNDLCEEINKLIQKFENFIHDNFREIKVSVNTIDENNIEIDYGFGKIKTVQLEQASQRDADVLSLKIHQVIDEITQNFCEYSSKSLLLIPKKINSLIPSAYKIIYGEPNFGDSNSHTLSYGFGFDTVSKLFYFNRKNGKDIYATFTIEEMFNPDEATLEKIKTFFKSWEEDHVFIPEQYLYIPNEYRFLLEDETLKNHIVFDISKRKEESPTRIEIGYDAVRFYKNGELEKSFFYKNNELDLNFFSELKSFALPLAKTLKIAESDAKIVAKRLVSKKVIDLATKILLSLAKSKKDIPAIERFLETSNGKTAIGLISSFMLKYSVKFFDPKYQPIVEEISTEMRISSETNLALETVEFVQETFLKGLAVDSPLVRIALEPEKLGIKFDETKDDAENIFLESDINSNKLMN